MSAAGFGAFERTMAGKPEDYFLKSARLGFRAWTMEDLPLATELWGDIKVTHFLGGPFSAEQIKERLARQIAWMNELGIQYWPIFLLSTGEHVGCCGLRPYRVDQKVYELGYHLKPLYWGQRLALEAAEAVIEFGFETLGATALFAGHHPENEVSRKLLLKLGFRYTHHEYHAPLNMDNPSYLLTRPA